MGDVGNSALSYCLDRMVHRLKDEQMAVAEIPRDEETRDLALTAAEDLTPTGEALDNQVRVSWRGRLFEDSYPRLDLPHVRRQSLQGKLVVTRKFRERFQLPNKRVHHQNPSLCSVTVPSLESISARSVAAA